MENRYKNRWSHSVKVLLVLLMAITVITSCMDDDYIYDDKEPDFLKGSIYQYLKESGDFTNYIRLIDDLNRKEYLNLTGSITLFVANDSAFNEFYKKNVWNVSRYEQLTQRQKKLIFNFSMIKNAYTLEKLSNYYDGNYHEGLAMRRYTALSAIDSVEFGKELPAGSYWDAYRNKGLYLMKDNTDIPFVFFSPQFMTLSGMTDEDFSFLSGGKERVKDDFFVFNKKVIKRDIICKNGYVNVLESVLTPPVNMAEYINSNPRTTIFSTLLERFSAPYYDGSTTALYKELNPDFTDSIFNKVYFADNGGTSVDPNGKAITVRLAYNPGWNAYRTTVNSSVYSDMAAMFVPSDEAMNDYINNDPTGSLLKERYGSWELLPNDVVVSFLTRHMQTSLLKSVPSVFSKMVDNQNYTLPVKKEDILTDYNYTAVNGEVYLTNKVYTPVDYISVYAPVLLTTGTKVINWAITRTEAAYDRTLFAFYKLYLNSMAAKYALFVPTDEYLTKYIDPVAYGQTGVNGALKYWYNEKSSTVNATIYTYSDGIVGDSVGVITDADFLQNRLWKLLDSHIVVGDVTGDGYYVTKANDIIKMSNSMQSVQGGFDIEKGTEAQVIRTFPQENGTTFTINSPINPALQSVYSAMGDISKTEFSDFFELLEGVPSDYGTELPQIFTSRGLDYCVSFFNSYNYTIYVPTNEAIQRALSNGVIKTWAQINLFTGDAKKAETQKMLRFLRYHFQDRSVFVGQTKVGTYETATLKLQSDNFPSYFNTPVNKSYKLGVEEDGGSIKLITESGKTARVILKDGYYNLIAKDYVFNSPTSTSTDFKNVDGTGATTATAFNKSRITASSSAVIHLIDDVLTFDE
ncbi:MAG: fasciclin domain-containing protein [Marinilabiliaceae bacterium]|nr:fasciclin domain-containing protein [Marinilabiliaceae bacterium]MBN2819108.1 fasciclin domain-containing protein [Bacteroidales bacterium]